MDAVSDRENRAINGSKSGGGDRPRRPKRQMKTPFQLETLEDAYASETYPCEATRQELSRKLGLTERQLQMWFCHRRLKEKKEGTAMKQLCHPRSKANKEVAAAVKQPVPKAIPDSPEDEIMQLDKPHSLHGGLRSGSSSWSGSGSESNAVSYRERWRMGMLPVMMDDDMPQMVRGYGELKPRLSMFEHRAAALVEAQLGEPLRDDGPILGVDFDPLPPDAFGAPIAISNHRKRRGDPYSCQISKRHKPLRTKDTMRSCKKQDLQQSSKMHSVHPSRKRSSIGAGPPRSYTLPFVNHRVQTSKNHGPRGDLSSGEDEQEDIYLSSVGDYGCLPWTTTFRDVKMDSDSAEDFTMSVDGKPSLSEATLKMYPQVEGVQMGDKAEAHEKWLKKDFEKKDILRRKKEEQIKNGTKKHDLEMKKHEKRLTRERQREEVRLQREQRRQLAQKERLLQKETLKAEKMKQKEELRREKELVKHKAAIERATARRIAKESMGLIDDGQLELMELVSLRKELDPVDSTECNTMQNLVSTNGFLTVFPPTSVKFKRPFSVQPWVNSDGNIGNLLMVWRFFISFADVLELWPFTLDEFVQALHDSDSRLLCEVHVALLKLVIKDVEDVSWAPSTGGTGVTQNNTSKQEGGHQSIVEGAHAWGFDISSWQHHLNALTWPEILRQFALAAGFGPQLKKRNTEPTDFHENCQDMGSADLVSTLRNGSAAESAAAMMQERGFSFARRSRHLLTPGTVKFAAFHVLSLEGSRGITILELADKIQRSGLRDLTTSKAPEASIAAALTRDARLFERTAPSTYCVRSPYRKDPADAELVLSSAREKLINTFGTEFVAGEEADVFEKDEDSECDVAKTSEAEDVSSPLNENIITSGYSCTVSAKQSIQCDDSVIVDDISGNNTYSECTEIDESKPYEQWVQGLAGGDYCALSVEERLDALVSLVSVVNEGKTVRTVLENRLEAANALKKQMWAEARLDKKYVAEEVKCMLPVIPFSGNGADAKFTNSPVKEKHHIDSHIAQTDLKSSPTDKTLAGRKLSTGLDILSHQYEKHAAERSHAQLKSFKAHQAEEMYCYRSLPLGQDRRHNRYWQFVASASCNDPGAGRIFIEFCGGHWQLIDSEEAFDALLASLDARGIREYNLLSMLLKIETSFKESERRSSRCSGIVSQCEMTAENKVPGMNLSSFSGSNRLEVESFKIEPGRNEADMRRYQDFQRWMFQDCFHSLNLCAKRHGEERCRQLSFCDLCLDSFDPEDKHCPSCHKTFSAFDETSNFSQHPIDCEARSEVAAWNLHAFLPIQTRLLKALLAFIEVSIPSEAFHIFWEDYRKIWGRKLHIASPTEDLLRVLTLLESAIRRDYLSSNFATTKELLGFRASSGSAAFVSACPEPLPVLPWIPVTTAAVILRLLELDASVSYKTLQKAELHLSSKEQSKKFPLYDAVEDNSGAFRRGQGFSGNDSRWQRRAEGGGSRAERGEGMTKRKRSSSSQICDWGRRMVRQKRPENRTAVGEASTDCFGDVVGPSATGESPRSSGCGHGTAQTGDLGSSSGSEEFEHGDIGPDFCIPASKGIRSSGSSMERGDDGNGVAGSDESEDSSELEGSSESEDSSEMEADAAGSEFLSESEDSSESEGGSNR